MSYLKSISVIFIIIMLSFVSIQSDANAMSENTSCSELWSNCTSTAIENYDNGTYTFDEFYLFYNTLCPMAYDDCINSELEIN